MDLVDKLPIDDLDLLKQRDYNHRIVINHKIFDTSHEDDIAKYIINDTRFGKMLLIRFEYYLSKTYHGLGKGDMVFYDHLTGVLYVLELKSLRDKYSTITDSAKIEKCIEQSIKYSKYTKNWCNKESIPVSVIEFNDGKIQIIETSHNDHNDNDDHNDHSKQNDNNDHNEWFSHPGDQTDTKYRINENTFESIRIVDYEPSAGSRRAFRKRVQRVCEETTKCTKYLAILKHVNGTILMEELHNL